MFRSTRALIHLDRLVNNARFLNEVAGASAFFCPMIKANAYGHGDVQVALALGKAGFPRVGVALVEEAIALRQGGFKSEVLVFGPLGEKAISAVDEFSLTAVVSRWEDLHLLARYQAPFSDAMPPKKELGTFRKIHIKFNTGMSRLGFAPEDAKKVHEFLGQNKGLQLAGVCTHLSHGDDAANPQGNSQTQIKNFNAIADVFKNTTLHCLNSSGLLSLRDLPANERARLGARPGISLYGLPTGQESLPAKLRPVLEWKSSVEVLQRVAKGKTVSYSGRWTAPQDSIVGVVPVGYADGYMRCLTNQSEMLFRGQRVKVVGTVCMDYTLLDLTVALRAAVAPGDRAISGGEISGEEVVIIGDQGQNEITAQELAAKANTITYEIVTNISARVPRQFVGATT